MTTRRRTGGWACGRDNEEGDKRCVDAYVERYTKPREEPVAREDLSGDVWWIAVCFGRWTARSLLGSLLRTLSCLFFYIFVNEDEIYI